MKIIHNNELYELLSISGGKYEVNSIEDAYTFCKKIAKYHYENFPVGSIFIPKKLRNYVYSIYSFARIADDIADEIKKNNFNKIKALDQLLDLVNDFTIINSGKGNPIILAIQDTIKKKNIPISTLERLITAFKMDSEFKQPQNFQELLNYCDYSANPIGEIVLRLFDEWSDENKLYSCLLYTSPSPRDS